MREAGLITITDPGSDKPFLEVPTRQCVHCGMHFPGYPDRGTKRGYCFNCHGPICGPGCAECIPIEQWLDNVEAGRAPNFRPIQAAVPRSVG